MPSNEPTTVVTSQPTIPIEAFNIETFAYKVIQGQPILLDLWVPKNLPSGECPVILRFHGGYLVCGSRDNLQLTPPRIIQYALDSKSILVSCDYRLLPESSGKDILEDIDDLWSWVHGRLQQALEVMTNGQNTADLQRVLLAGESAGGYLALQLALSHPTAIRAVIASYPMIDMQNRHFSEAYPKQMGQYPQMEFGVVAQHLSQLPDGIHPTTRSVSNLPIAIIQHGLYQKFLGEHRSLFPIARLEDDPELAHKLPFIWLHHGTNDSEVPIDGSRKFVEKLRELNPKAQLRYKELEGMEHGVSSEIYLIQSGEWDEGSRHVNGLLFE
ncbi:Alpha/Beta hydrolase protein [Ilyonectria destructans]|nr:Alpha/Beta hydrolase protein [Ilyonectria destructans]